MKDNIFSKLISVLSYEELNWLIDQTKLEVLKRDNVAGVEEANSDLEAYPPLSDYEKEQVRAGKPTEAILSYRNRHSCSLLNAKKIVEDWQD